MTWQEDLSSEQKDMIEELRRRTIHDVTPKMLEDETLFYRFAKARNFNLEKSEDMLRKHISWRKEFKVDTIVTEHKTPEVLEKYGPTSVICFDKEGCIVRYFDVGGCDMKGVLKSSTKVDFMKYAIRETEKDLEILKEQTAKLGKPITKWVHIQNYDKLTLAKATYKPALDLMFYVIKGYQDNYPERIKSIYIINVSLYFTVLFSVLKTVMAAELLEKIQIFRTTSSWKEALAQTIDADQLPAFLGGNRTDPDGDPLCKTFIVHGQPVPERYFLTKSQKQLSLVPGVKTLKLHPFSKQEIRFEVNDPGSYLEWEFETKSKDIGFGIYYKAKSYDDTKLVELVPKQRIDTDYESETGLYKCEKAGIYIIVFDNSYSWIYAKEIYYNTRITASNEIENNSEITCT